MASADGPTRPVRPQRRQRLRPPHRAGHAPGGSRQSLHIFGPAHRLGCHSQNFFPCMKKTLQIRFWPKNPGCFAGNRSIFEKQSNAEIKAGSQRCEQRTANDHKQIPCPSNFVSIFFPGLICGAPSNATLGASYPRDEDGHARGSPDSKLACDVPRGWANPKRQIQQSQPLCLRACGAWRRKCNRHRNKLFRKHSLR